MSSSAAAASVAAAAAASSSQSTASLRAQPYRVMSFRRAGFHDLVAGVLLGDVTPQQTSDMIDLIERELNFERRAQTGAKMSLLLDVSAIGNVSEECALPVRAFMARNQDSFRRFSVCTAIVVGGVLTRLIIRALFAIQRPASVVIVRGSGFAAIEELTSKYRVTMPELLELEAIGLQLEARGGAAGDNGGSEADAINVDVTAADAASA